MDTKVTGFITIDSSKRLTHLLGSHFNILVPKFLIASIRTLGTLQKAALLRDAIIILMLLQKMSIIYTLTQLFLANYTTHIHSCINIYGISH